MQLTHLHIPKLSSVTQCNTDISHAPPYKEESLYIRHFHKHQSKRCILFHSPTHIESYHSSKSHHANAPESAPML